MIYLVAYDISDNRLRTKIANKLIAYGLYRVQYSVFMGTMRLGLKDKLQAWLNQKINTPANAKDTQKIIILPLLEGQLERLVSIGEFSLSLDEIKGEMNTLYFG